MEGDTEVTYDDYRVRGINRRLVTARRVFRRADSIPDTDRKLTQGNVTEISRLLDELEEMCQTP